MVAFALILMPIQIQHLLKLNGNGGDEMKANVRYSNTTLVKVKYIIQEIIQEGKNKFKYNTC